MTSHAEYLATRSFGALDGLRALSIIAVVWHHTYEVPTGWPATQRGFLGVDLFFVISGFLIVTLLLRERDRRGAISLKKFYVRRLLRIAPVYYGLLLGLAAVFVTVGRNSAMRDAFFSDLPWAFLYLSNWVGLTTFLEITWSLSAEEQFYFLWPPIERFAPRKAVPILVALLIVSQVIHFRLAEGVMQGLGFAPHQPEMLRQTGFTPIMLGVLLAHGLHHPRTFALLRPLLAPRVVSVLACVAVLAIASVPVADITGFPRVAIHLAMTVLVASAVVREDHLLMPLLRLRPIVAVGVLSYGIYLFHMLSRHVVLAGLTRLGSSSPSLLFVGTLLMTVAVAAVSYALYERRFLALKERFNA